MARRNKDKTAPDAAPVSTELHPLQQRLARGDYAGARAKAKRVLGSSGASETDLAAARDVVARTGLEPGALSVGTVAFAIIGVIAALLYLH